MKTKIESYSKQVIRILKLTESYYTFRSITYKDRTICQKFYEELRSRMHHLINDDEVYKFLNTPYPTPENYVFQGENKNIIQKNLLLFLDGWLSHEKTNKEEVLVNAAGFGLYEVVKQLMQEGINPTGCRNYAIYLATDHRHFDVVNLLLSNIDINIDEIIWLPISKNDVEMTNLFFKDNRANLIKFCSLGIEDTVSAGHIDMLWRVMTKDGVESPWFNHAMENLKKINPAIALQFSQKVFLEKDRVFAEFSKERLPSKILNHIRFFGHALAVKDSPSFAPSTTKMSLY